ncbi:hypothetical protein RDWZM_002818 [Blomia tropicalis]|uniref:Nose resistant-to-fluoxetine protein N-terminal domain-containing protein n=1 Tax=Blomia tropicalis TaxID=40697 RepID=A0A9Q0RQ93_BLOTA|nr:hypothetical protein RDWZM_002818 [Blomia tropicalis]
MKTGWVLPYFLLLTISIGLFIQPVYTNDVNDSPNSESELNEVETTTLSDSNEPSESTVSEETTEDDGGDDPWGEEDDEKGGTVNIVDQMRELREPEKTIPIERFTKNLNDTFERMAHAYGIIDQYYLPSKATWEKLLGLVTGLDVQVSPECFSSYFSGVSGFRGYKTWAYRFLDVRGRFPESGSMAGRLSSFGEWDECMQLESPQHSSTGLIVKGQYCMLEVKAPYPMNTDADLALLADKRHPLFNSFQKYLKAFRLHNLNTPAKMVETLRLMNGTIFRAGLCVPHLCKAHEIEAVITNLTYPIFKMPITVGPKCFKGRSTSILTLLTTFVIFCTVVEWYNQSFDKRTAKDNHKLGALMFQRDVAFKPNPFLYSFSAITNTRAVLRKHTSFAALDTIKFMMVIYIHLYNYYNNLSTVGLVTLKRIFTTYPATGMRDDRYTWFRLTLPFDAIFIISGMVIAFSMQRKLKMASSNFNYFSYSAKLWIKFAVTYAGSIMFLWVLPTVTTGPVWDYGMNWLNGCFDLKTVLLGFLFVSNYNTQLGTNVDNPSVLPFCNPPTWFMSSLLQLLLLAPLFVFVGYKLSKYAKISFFLLLVIGSGVLAIVPYLALNIKPDVHFLEFETLRETALSFAWYRMGTNTYLLSFVFGIIGGYMLADFKVLLRQELENAMVIISFVLVQVAIALNNSFWRLDKPPSLVKSLIWYSVVRSLQSLGLTYIFYTLSSNRAASVQRFLEWHPFQVLSRLSYSYFMVHILIVYYRIFSVKEVYAMTNSLMLQNFIIDFFITLVIAYLFYCLIECPVANLLNLAHGKIFYDVKHYKPKRAKLDGVQSVDQNGNGAPVSKGEHDTGIPFPPSIVIEEYNHDASNEFEMNQQSTGESNNSNNINQLEESNQVQPKEISRL